MQPIIDEHFYKLGAQAKQQGRGTWDCQQELNNIPNLTSDQYDSFWLGYGETTK